MSFDKQSYRDYLHNAIQSEDYYWNYIEEIQRSLLTDKEKPKYTLTLDLVNEVLRDMNEKGLVKMLACSQNAFPANTDYVTRLLKHKLLLEVINETCQFRADVQDDKRGGTMFKDEGKEIGETHLKYALEFIKMLASIWEKTKTKSGDQVPTQFYVIYHQLLDAGVKFPDRFEYFEEVKKKKKSSNNNPATKPQTDFIQIYKESFNLIESILHIVNDNLKIEDFVKEAIEGQEHAFKDELQTLTNILNTQGDNANQLDKNTLWKAYYFYQELTQTIIQLKSRNFAEKTYKAFRKNLLHQAEEYYPTLWSAPEPPAQSFSASNAFDTKPQSASAIPIDNNDLWGEGASDFDDFGFNNNNEKSKPADECFGGFRNEFNFFPSVKAIIFKSEEYHPKLLNPFKPSAQSNPALNPFTFKEFQYSIPQESSKIDFIQIYQQSFNLINSILLIVKDNLEIKDFIEEVIEGQESAFKVELKNLTTILNIYGDNENQTDIETLWKAYSFYKILIQMIIQLKEKNYAEKTYIAFRKNLLHQAEEFYPKLWNPRSPYNSLNAKSKISFSMFKQQNSQALSICGTRDIV